jgi:hypothetical protein
MKVTINIECDNLEECAQISRILEDLKLKKERKPVSEREMQGIEKVKGMEASGSRFIPLTQWGNYHPWPSVPALRNLVFFSETNGFKDCIKRVGRRVIIDEKAFFEWVSRQ